MFNIGPMELILILVVVLIVFGPGRLPEVARSLGKAVNEFRRASSGVQRMWEEVVRETSAEPAPQSTVQVTASQEKQPKEEQGSKARTAEEE